MERISGKKSNKNKEIKNVKRPKGKKLISSRNFVDSFRIARQNERNIENVIEKLDGGATMRDVTPTLIRLESELGIKHIQRGGRED